MRTSRRRYTAALVVAGVSVLAFAGGDPAGASCAPAVGVADGITQADVVVVGTVTSARSADRVATIHVEEVWKGEVGETFEVFGGPAAENALTSVDRTYEVGRRYLLFAREPAAHGNPAIFGGRYEDNDCSSTQLWTDSLVQYRPATASVVGKRAGNAPPVPTSPPAAAGASHGSTVGWWLLVVPVGCGLLLAIGLIRRGRGAHRGAMANAVGESCEHEGA